MERGFLKNNSFNLLLLNRHFLQDYNVLLIVFGFLLSLLTLLSQNLSVLNKKIKHPTLNNSYYSLYFMFSGFENVLFKSVSLLFLTLSLMHQFRFRSFSSESIGFSSLLLSTPERNHSWLPDFKLALFHVFFFILLSAHQRFFSFF
jgi:hypothetical protein